MIGPIFLKLFVESLVLPHLFSIIHMFPTIKVFIRRGNFIPQYLVVQHFPISLIVSIVSIWNFAHLIFRSFFVIHPDLFDYFDFVGFVVDCRVIFLSFGAFVYILIRICDLFLILPLFFDCVLVRLTSWIIVFDDFQCLFLGIHWGVHDGLVKILYFFLDSV